MTDEEYPECKKWAKAHDRIMAIQEFREFLDSKGYHIGKKGADDYSYFCVLSAIDSEDLLYEFLGVDPKKLEAERRLILKSIGG